MNRYCSQNLTYPCIFHIGERQCQLTKINLDSMSCIRKLYYDKGISDEIAKTIIQSWQPNTKCKYDTYRKQWLQFCSQRMCDLMCPTLVIVLEFLHVLRKRNLGYSVLNSARGMLSSSATIEGYDAGKQPLVYRHPLAYR